MNNPVLHNPQFEGGTFYWEAGSTGVLLLHGLTATTNEVRRLARQLYGWGYTVSGPLLPGHGTTPEDLNQTEWIEWVQAAESAYFQLLGHCDHVFVGGESAGAVIALYLASTHPEICGILCYAPAVKLAMKSIDRIRLFLSAPFVSAVPKGSISSSSNWQGYPVNPLKASIELLHLEDEVIGRLSNIEQPLLVVSGKLDKTIDPAGVDILCAGVRSKIKERYVMEESSHVVLLDSELDQVVALTLNFMEQALQPQPGLE
jgi:carboxylesterase